MAQLISRWHFTLLVDVDLHADGVLNDATSGCFRCPTRPTNRIPESCLQNGAPKRQPPGKHCDQVRSLAKTRKLSSNRMLVELIENGIEAEMRKQQEFFKLAERFRNATDPGEARRVWR